LGFGSLGVLEGHRLASEGVEEQLVELRLRVRVRLRVRLNPP
jgi:hypothetical protein